MTRDDIYKLIDVERDRQHRLHPEWYDDQHGLVVLAEEFGEVAKSLYELSHAPTMSQSVSWEKCMTIRERLDNDLEDEIVQVAAVCIRWLENRGGGQA